MPGLTTGKNVAITERARATRNQKIPSNIAELGQDFRKLFVRQENQDMPDDGENFPPTILWGEKFDIFAVMCHWKDFEGTFECKVNIKGDDIIFSEFDNLDFTGTIEAIPVPPFNIANLSGKIFPAPISYESTDRITVKVIESDGIEEWEAIFYMREVL